MKYIYSHWIKRDDIRQVFEGNNKAIENWTNGETEFIEFSLLSLLLEFSGHLKEYFRTDT